MSPEVIEDARGRLRASRKAPARSSWRPPELTDLAPYLHVLAFDASLANVGWAELVAWEGDRVKVGGHGTIHPRQSDLGYLGTWQRMRDLQEALWHSEFLMRRMQDRDILKAVEAPAVGAGSRKESSLIAGGIIWTECNECMAVSATHVSAVLLGDPKILSRQRKKAIREAVCRLVPEAAGRTWTEHERDALSVGLTRLYDLREAA